MEDLIIRIKSNDFSAFSGYYYTNDSYTQNNEKLNEYIRLYKETDCIKYFQIECGKDFPMHCIAYICDRIGEKYFINTEHSKDNISNKTYWLCFYKE